MILTHRNIEGIDIVSLAGRLVMADVPGGPAEAAGDGRAGQRQS